MYKLSAVLFSFFICLFAANAQNQEFGVEDINDEISKIKLPPIEIFLDAAVNSSPVNIAKERVEVQKLNQRVLRREWLSYITLKATYNYGIMGNYSSYTDDYTPLLSRFSGTTQNAWVVGGMISIPLGDLFSRATKGRINKQRIKDATHEMILAEENMKLRIIEIYSNIEINLNLLKTRISSVSFYKSQYEIAQQDFISGRKNYDQLVTPRFNMVKAIDEYENCRGSLKSLILQLELLTKVPIISLDELELNKNQTDTGK